MTLPSSSPPPPVSPSFNPPVLPPLPPFQPSRAPPHPVRAPPSPSTTAAALSLGALASAASLATSSPVKPSPPPMQQLSCPSPTSAAIPAIPSIPAIPTIPSIPTNTAQPRRPKQRRYRASPAQLTHLLAKFEHNPSPSSTELQQLSAAIDMPFQSAVLWFKNRRARVPHKKAEKAAAAARRRAAAAAAKQKQQEVAAATCMAELAFRRTSSQLVPTRCVSPPAARTKATTCDTTAEPSTPVTPRRPRARFIPPTPRLLSQREYGVGDGVEVMESDKGICRSWYSAVIVSRAPAHISLGASAGASAGAVGTDSVRVGGTGRVVHDEVAAATAAASSGDKDDGDESPRTVRSPVASPTPAAARIWYVVRYEHRLGEGGNKLEEEVLAKRMRPKAPELDSWRPDIGDAIEVLKDGGWFIGVIQTLVIRKGYLVSFENGQVEWRRRHLLRPYQIWRGGDNWVVKKKAPLMVVRKSVGLSVTHPVCGKRKACRNGGSGDGEWKGSRKRAKSATDTVADGSGPDGLPEGWRVGCMSGANGATVYVAPDGQRLRSLKEAQRYVRLMQR